MDNLPELRDIHLPVEGVSIFPLALGWWGILIAVLLLLFMVWAIKVIRKKSKKLYAKYLLNKFAKENTIESAAKMSEILRRICLKKYPQAVVLSGNDWTDFILHKTSKKMNEKLIDLLQTAPYRAKDDLTFSEEDIADLRKFCFDWVGENL